MSGERLQQIYAQEILSKFRRKEREYSVGSLENKSIAIYLGRDSELLDKAKFKLKQKRAKYINFDMDDRLAGQTILKRNPKFAYRKAGTVMLDAFDSGVELLACVNRDDYRYFKSVHSMAERETGRDIDLNLMVLDI